MDWLLWVVRAIIIIVGIILAIIIWKGKKEGRYQEYSLRFFVIGITIFILGIILLVVSFITDLSLFYGFYLAAAGAIGIIIGLVIRNIWEKNR
jgi:putative flippase GtrA